jgi:hypothetical protein
MRDEQILSVRDRIFGTVAGFSALFCFAVSFALKLPGRAKAIFYCTRNLCYFFFTGQTKKRSWTWNTCFHRFEVHLGCNNTPDAALGCLLRRGGRLNRVAAM